MAKRKRATRSKSKSSDTPGMISLRRQIQPKALDSVEGVEYKPLPYLLPEWFPEDFYYKPAAGSLPAPPRLIVPPTDGDTLTPLPSRQEPEVEVRAARSLLGLSQNRATSSAGVPMLYTSSPTSTDSLGAQTPRNDDRTAEMSDRVESMCNFNALLTHIHAKSGQFGIAVTQINDHVRKTWFEVMNEPSHIGWNRDALCWVAGRKLWKAIFPNEILPGFFDRPPRLLPTTPGTPGSESDVSVETPAKKMKHHHCSHHPSKHHHHHHHHHHQHEETITAPPTTEESTRVSPEGLDVIHLADLTPIESGSKRSEPLSLAEICGTEQKEQAPPPSSPSSDSPSVSINLPDCEMTKTPDWSRKTSPSITHESPRRAPTTPIPNQEDSPTTNATSTPGSPASQARPPLTYLPDLPTLIRHKVFLLGSISTTEYEETLSRFAEEAEAMTPLMEDKVYSAFGVCERLWNHFFPGENWPFGYLPGGGQSFRGIVREKK